MPRTEADIRLELQDKLTRLNRVFDGVKASAEKGSASRNTLTDFLHVCSDEIVKAYDLAEQTQGQDDDAIVDEFEKKVTKWLGTAAKKGFQVEGNPFPRDLQQYFTSLVAVKRAEKLPPNSELQSKVISGGLDKMAMVALALAADWTKLSALTDHEAKRLDSLKVTYTPNVGRYNQYEETKAAGSTRVDFATVQELLARVVKWDVVENEVKGVPHPDDFQLLMGEGRKAVELGAQYVTANRKVPDAFLKVLNNLTKDLDDKIAIYAVNPVLTEQLTNVREIAYRIIHENEAITINRDPVDRPLLRPSTKQIDKAVYGEMMNFIGELGQQEIAEIEGMGRVVALAADPEHALSDADVIRLEKFRDKVLAVRRRYLTFWDNSSGVVDASTNNMFDKLNLEIEKYVAWVDQILTKIGKSKAPAAAPTVVPTVPAAATAPTAISSQFAGGVMDEDKRRYVQGLRAGATTRDAWLGVFHELSDQQLMEEEASIDKLESALEKIPPKTRFPGKEQYFALADELKTRADKLDATRPDLAKMLRGRAAFITNRILEFDFFNPYAESATMSSQTDYMYQKDGEGARGDSFDSPVIGYFLNLNAPEKPGEVPKNYERGETIVRVIREIEKLLLEVPDLTKPFISRENEGSYKHADGTMVKGWFSFIVSGNWGGDDNKFKEEMKERLFVDMNPDPNNVQVTRHDISLAYEIATSLGIRQHLFKDFNAIGDSPPGINPEVGLVKEINPIVTQLNRASRSVRFIPFVYEGGEIPDAWLEQMKHICEIRAQIRIGQDEAKEKRTLSRSERKAIEDKVMERFVTLQASIDATKKLRKLHLVPASGELHLVDIRDNKLHHPHFKAKDFGPETMLFLDGNYTDIYDVYMGKKAKEYLQIQGITMKTYVNTKAAFHKIEEHLLKDPPKFKDGDDVGEYRKKILSDFKQILTNTSLLKANQKMVNGSEVGLDYARRQKILFRAYREAGLATQGGRLSFITGDISLRRMMRRSLLTENYIEFGFGGRELNHPAKYNVLYRSRGRRKIDPKTYLVAMVPSRWSDGFVWYGKAKNHMNPPSAELASMFNPRLAAELELIKRKYPSFERSYDEYGREIPLEEELAEEASEKKKGH